MVDPAVGGDHGDCRLLLAKIIQPGVLPQAFHLRVRAKRVEIAAKDRWGVRLPNRGCQRRKLGLAPVLPESEVRAPDRRSVLKKGAYCRTRLPATAGKGNAPPLCDRVPGQDRIAEGTGAETEPSVKAFVMVAQPVRNHRELIQKPGTWQKAVYLLKKNNVGICLPQGGDNLIKRWLVVYIRPCMDVIACDP
jgi:hypothetical protein